MGQKKKHLIFGILTEFQVFLAHIFVKNGGGCGIRTHVGVNPNGFQDRLVMTASITLRMKLWRCGNTDFCENFTRELRNSARWKSAKTLVNTRLFEE